MSQGYVWLVSWIEIGQHYGYGYYEKTQRYKVFTNKTAALDFKYRLMNSGDCENVRLTKRYD